MLSRADKIFIALIGAGVLSIYVGVVSMYLWLGLMLVRLFFLNRVELGLFSLMFGSSLFGRLFASDQLVVVLTTGFLILGYILLRKEILQTIVHNRVSWIVFAALLFYFVVMYLLGPMNSYATGKISRLVVRGITWLLMFQIYVQSRDVNNNHFAILFGLLSIFYLSQAYVVYGVRPHSLLDVSFFRDIAAEVGRDDSNTMVVNSHTLGYLATGTLLFFISHDKYNVKSLWSWTIISISLLIVIISGARHTMVIFASLLSFRFILNNGMAVKNITIACACLFLLGFIIFNSGVSSIEKSKAGTSIGETFNRDFETPFYVMQIDPVFGVGFGGYQEYGNKKYPHNILFEIFSEFGAVGSAIILTFIVISVLISNIYIRYYTGSGVYFILFLTMYLLCALVSGDLSSNIRGFAVLLSFVKTPQQKMILKKDAIG